MICSDDKNICKQEENKMKYQKEIDTIAKSISHWKKHIVDELDFKNRAIVKDKNGWLLWENNNKVGCYSDQCPLCIAFKTKTLECEKCPYKLEFNEICLFTDEPWRNFNKNPNTKTATEMVWKLAELSKYYYIDVVKK